MADGEGSAPPPAIQPDEKNWTWVLERPCPECGFDTRTVGREDIPDALRTVAERLQEAVEAAGDPRNRPSAEVWSPLEYTCHVRDVFLLFDERLIKMLTEDDPLYPNWSQDETAVEERYWEQDPAIVLREMRDAAEALAAHFEGVTGGEWQRSGRRSDGASFTVETMGRYLIHDPVHHLYDITGERQEGFG